MFSTANFLQEINKRQKDFRQKITQIHIFFGAKEKKRNNDVYFPFRQESSFLYLTGFPEANAIAIFEPNGDYTLFVEKKDPIKELWTGYRYGADEAKKKFGADKTYTLDKFEKILPKIIHDATIILTEQNSFIPFLGKFAKQIVFNREVITQMRLIKSAWEIEQMLKASEISSFAHKKMIKERLNYKFEFEFEALFRYETMKRGALQLAYPTIIAAGENGCVLHYTKNNAKINTQDLVLIDAGCEWHHYAADITRTFPIGEKFSPKQKMLYEIVLQTQIQIIQSISPNISMTKIHHLACHQLTSGLIEIGLLKNSIEQNLEEKNYKTYFPHGIGHQLGLDVHDIIDDKQKEKKLQKGMVLTIEPGLYFQPDDMNIPVDFRGIGIRIEDNILIKENGYQNLTTAPKLTKEIEL